MILLRNKIKKDFLEEAKNRILSDLSGISDLQKKSLKFVESQGKACKTGEIMEKALGYNPSSGSRTKVLEEIKSLVNLNVIIFDAKNGHKPRLKIRLKEILELHGATEQEIDQVYNHILMEMLK